MGKIIEIKGSVLITERKWWQLFKFGWYRHNTILGPAWIRFSWPPELQPQKDFFK